METLSINLKAETSQENIILEYLNKTASNSLRERINNGTKTLAQCWDYIITEARKLAQNGCACVEDSTVFGWAIHFFEEDEIKGEDFKKTASAKVITANEKKKAKATVTKQDATAESPKAKNKKQESAPLEQFSFDSLFG